MTSQQKQADNSVGRLVLHRKWRSRDFSEIVGQSHVVRTLKNALSLGRIAPAYLFCGPRGTGKTSMARIMAKSINCPQSKEGMPCNRCRVCGAITEGSFLDVIEMDAASHTQVDKIREFIVEKVNFRPVQAPRKIYIIDEVHKLSSYSFDALLKTIEEPPPFVTFILATTEPEKLPPTILSRCQRFDFKRISINQIVEHLKNICEAEGFCIEEGALNLIAQSADGALRDALVVLEQAVSFSSECIGVGDVVSMLGITRQDLLFDFADKVVQKDTRGALEFIDNHYRDGGDLQRLAVDLLEHFRRLLLVRMVREAETILEVTSQEYKLLAEQAQHFSGPRLLHIISELMDLRKNLREAGMERILWEMTAVKLTRWETAPSIDLLVKRVERLEKTLAGKSIPPPENKEKPGKYNPPAVDLPADPPVTAPEPEADLPTTPGNDYTPDSVDDSALWHKMLREVKKDRFNLIPVLDAVGAGKLAGNEYHMKVDHHQSFNRNLIDKNRKYLEEVLGRLTGNEVKLKLVGSQSRQLFDTAEVPHSQLVDQVMDMFGASPVDKPV